VLAKNTPSFAQNTPYVGEPPLGQSPILTEPPVPTKEVTVSGYRGPSRVLLGTGVLVFGLAYVPAFAVAAGSTLKEDQFLYIPVVGPWIDLGVRPACGARLDCDLDSLNKALLVADGLFQDFGVLAIAGSFLVPERGAVTVRTAKAEGGPRLHVTPARLGPDAYGMVASGDF
jgi:hypothetical protein